MVVGVGCNTWSHARHAAFWEVQEQGDQAGPEKPLVWKGTCQILLCHPLPPLCRGAFLLPEVVQPFP